MYSLIYYTQYILLYIFFISYIVVYYSAIKEKEILLFYDNMDASEEQYA